jgi:predicted DCC family thiol-disulfide oxidoreductase YuxK
MTRFIDQIKELYPKLKTQYGLDLRGVAVFRIGLATILLVYLTNLFIHLQAFFTDEGIVPLRALMETNKLHWSLLTLSGSWEVQAVLLILAVLFAVAMLVGYRTKLFTFLSWVMLASLRSRNPFIYSEAEILLQQLLLWGVFLPLGAFYSVDSALVPDGEWTSPKPKRIFSLASIGLLFQVFFVYFMTGMAKLYSPEWTEQGTALYYGLSLTSFQTALTPWLLNLPSNMLRSLSFFTLYLEVYGSWLLLTPFFVQPLRTFIILLFILFHLGIASFLSLGTFPWIEIVALLALMPSLVWDSLENLLRGHPKILPLSIYYDGDCGFCKKILRLLLTFALLEQIPMLPAQSDMRMQEQMNRYNSWVLIDCEKKPHYGAEALAHLLQASPILFILGKLLAIPAILAIVQQLYAYVADHRSQFSRLTHLLSWRSNPVQLSEWGHLFSGILVCLLFLVNLVHFLPDPTIHKPLKQIVSTLHMEQTWKLFAPRPPRFDTWNKVTAKLNDGTTDVIFIGRCANGHSTNPSSLIPDYCGPYWQMYASHLAASCANCLHADRFFEKYPHYLRKRFHARKIESEALIPYFADFLCRRWNTDPHHQNRQIESLSLELYSSLTPLPGKGGGRHYNSEPMLDEMCPANLLEEKEK